MNIQTLQLINGLLSIISIVPIFLVIQRLISERTLLKNGRARLNHILIIIFIFFGFRAILQAYSYMTIFMGGYVSKAHIGSATVVANLLSTAGMWLLWHFTKELDK